jgi:hypothetical protein
MRQIIALVSDGKVKYAVADDDTGELTEFAQVLVPERFGMTEAAALGVNLQNVIGLNSRKPLKRPEPSQPQLMAAEIEAAVDAKRKPGRPKGRARSGVHLPPGTRTKAGYKSGGRYITEDEVVAVVNAHPAGISIPDIAKELTRPGEEYSWVRTSVNNRITGLRAKAERGQPRVQETSVFAKDRGQQRPLLLPLQPQQPQQPQQPLQGGLQS